MRKFSELRDGMPEKSRADSGAKSRKMMDGCNRPGIRPSSVPAATIEDGEGIVERRAGRFSSEDVHQAVFDTVKPEAKSEQELREGIRTYIRKRYSRS